jgi:hypothetical protein
VGGRAAVGAFVPTAERPYIEPEAGGQACVFRRAGLVLGEPGEDLIENSNPGDYPSPGNELPKMAGPPSCDVLRGFKHTHTHTRLLTHSVSLLSMFQG